MVRLMADSKILGLPPKTSKPANELASELMRERNHVLIAAINSFCRRCLGIDYLQTYKIKDCNEIQCPLYPVRFGNTRNQPTKEILKIRKCLNKTNSGSYPWSRQEDHFLLDWRNERKPKPWWWIAIQLRRPERAIITRYAKLVPPNPLKELE